MGLFKKKLGKPERSFDERWAEELEENRTNENAILETIGLSTDPLAQEALRLVDNLPASERTVFLQNVLRRLVVQALHAARALDQDHADRLRYFSLDGFGSGSTGISVPGNLARKVIAESLGDPAQGELQFTE